MAASKEADGEAEVEAAWAFVVILEHTGAKSTASTGLPRGPWKSGMVTRAPLLGLEPSKLDVILRTSLVLRGRVGGASPGWVLSWARTDCL